MFVDHCSRLKKIHQRKLSMTGISGVEFASWALPITGFTLVVGFLIINRFGPSIEKWGKKHIHKK